MAKTKKIKRIRLYSRFMIMQMSKKIPGFNPGISKKVKLNTIFCLLP